MKSTEFITESKYGSEEELYRYAERIQRDCQPYLNAINNQVDRYEIYRGMKRVHSAFSKRTVRLDKRNPTDSPRDVHDAVNEYFHDTFGAPFRNAMFCTGNLTEVREYGEAFVVYPIGDFEFLWSPYVDDMFKEWEDFNIETNLDTPQFIKTRIAGKFFNTDIKKAIDSEHEIMIRCNNYYAVDVGLAWDLHEYMK